MNWHNDVFSKCTPPHTCMCEYLVAYRIGKWHIYPSVTHVSLEITDYINNELKLNYELLRLHYDILAILYYPHQ